MLQYTSEIHTKRLKDLGVTISVMAKVEPQITVALSASGEAQNARKFI
jgi:hypothetical protein